MDDGVGEGYRDAVKADLVDDKQGNIRGSRIGREMHECPR